MAVYDMTANGCQGPTMAANGVLRAIDHRCLLSSLMSFQPINETAETLMMVCKA
jgi:hypothetical protein